MRLKWRPVPKARQVPPESSVAMVVRLRLVDLLHAEQLHLMVQYEVGATAEKNAWPRQLHLITFDVKKLLDATESLAPTFSAKTLHQDFLAVIMTHQAHCSLKLVFQAAEDCTTFEQQLVSKLQFELIKVQEPEKEQSEWLPFRKDHWSILTPYVFQNLTCSTIRALTHLFSPPPLTPPPPILSSASSTIASQCRSGVALCSSATIPVSSGMCTPKRTTDCACSCIA